MDDAELVDGLLRGEGRCQLALLGRYLDQLARHLLGFRTLDSGDAEDIAVEVLNQLIMDPSVINLSKGKGSLRKLVFRMARNKAIDLHRKRLSSLAGRKIVSLAALDTPEDTRQIIDRRPWHGSEGPRHEIPPDVSSEVQQLVDDLNLSEEQWEHLRLRIVDKLQAKEIAAFLKIDPNNERVRWHRLQKKITSKSQQYPRLVEYGKEIGALGPETEFYDIGSEPRSD